LQENELIQARKYDKEQEEIKHIKDFIGSCGTYADKMKQAKSKQKILDKMEAVGLTKPVESQVRLPRTLKWRSRETHMETAWDEMLKGRRTCKPLGMRW
jgi:ATPase subunit of ABC transporter with duplicated ATPase domains